MTKDEALRLALEYVELVPDDRYSAEHIDRDALITAIKAALEAKDEPDWKALVLNHNADCESRCDMDRCGYKPYFEHNKRRCPDCPVHERIDVEYTPPQRKPLTDEQIDLILEAAKVPDYPGQEYIDKQIARAIEAAHGIKGEA
jgi:hypothetical protein